MKRIALITSRFPYGGKEAFLAEEISELSRVCDLVIVPALPTKEPATARHVPSVRLRLFSAAVLAAAAAEAFRAPAKALRAFFAVARAPRSLGSKCKNVLAYPTGLAAARVLRKRRVEHVHAYWLAIPATVAYVAATMNDLPWSATGHRYDLVDSNMSGAGLHDSFISTARFIRTISKAGEQRVRGALGRDVPARLFTAHLGVRLPSQSVTPRAPERFRLICAANLEYVKGHGVLLEAVACALAEGIAVDCTLAGDGSLRRSLETRARMLGLADRVHFEGFVPHDRLLDAMQSGTYDAAILTSVDEGPHECEGIPMFLAESMAAGLPVIATRSGAVEELVDSSNGILCPLGNARSVAAAIATLSRDPALARRLGAAGRLTVERRFNAAENARQVAQLLGVEGAA